MDCEDLPGRVGVVLVATERVCAISVRVNTEQSLVLALGEVVFSGPQPTSNLKHLENKPIKFDAIRDLRSSFGSFWKAIHAWTATKVQNTNPSVDWIKLKPKYNNSKEDIEELFRTRKPKIMGFLLNGIPLAEDLLLCRAGNHLQSLGQRDANLEKKSIQFYVSLIVERGGAIDCLHAHSFLQKKIDLRNHLKSNYQFSNLMDFFHNHPKYFLVKKIFVSIQPVWFLTALQFVSNQEEPAEFTGNSSTTANGKSTKSKKDVGDLDHKKVKRDVAAILRSVVLSSKGGVPLQKLQDEYRSLVGKAIPYQESGYSSLESMLNEMQDVVHLIRTAGGQILVTAVDDSSTDHLVRLIARQKGSKPLIGRQPSAQVPIAVKSCVPALERKAILFFAQGISNKRHSEGGETATIINAQTAQGLLTDTAGGEVDRYVAGALGGDPNLLFLRYPECFHVTKTGNIFPRPYKKILEFVNMKTFALEVAQRSKKPAEPCLPTPLCESPVDTRSESSYSESSSCFSEPTPRSSYPTKEASKEQTRLLFDTLKNLLGSSDTYGAGGGARTPRSLSEVPDLLEIYERPEEVGSRDLIDLGENLNVDHLTPKEGGEREPRTRDIACQTISTGPILSMSVYNL